MQTRGIDLSWAPSTCTLPTTEQPLRLAEFDDLFARHVRQVRRVDATHLWLALTGGPEVAATAAGLAARETECCRFFTFELQIGDGALALGVSTGPAHADVLAALADRATALVGPAGS
ncbi:hypothetical protein [Jatrophihabitans sp.]|jgi:hypothetical protein|uniref:hypothetical protein n=1 Tax=Jatrophihabitans sp. TaxID=1932789 RepID=UPI002F158149